VYPKGYVEMLEQQQSQLVAGLQEMYKRLVSADAWKGLPLAESNGNPLTHDILAALDLLETKPDGSGELESFEEDCEKLQSKLLAEGAGYTQPHRRSSFSSESEHSSHGHSHGHTRTHSRRTPSLSSKPVLYKTEFASQPPTPPADSPMAGHHHLSYPPTHPSPLQHDSPLSDDQFYHSSTWPFSEPGANPNYSMQAPEVNQNMGSMEALPSFGQWDAPLAPHELGMPPMPSYSMPQPMASGPRHMNGLSMGSSHDPSFNFNMDVDFNSFISVMT
jgi:hypothetical protein